MKDENIFNIFIKINDVPVHHPVPALGNTGTKVCTGTGKKINEYFFKNIKQFFVFNYFN